MTESFRREQLCVMENLVGKKMLSLFYQPTAGILSEENMFIINFGNKKIEYSLHAFTCVRFRDENNILLTSADEFFAFDYTQLSDEEYESQEGFEKSLISFRINSVKERLKNAKVLKCQVLNCGDIIITFDKGIFAEILIDCSYQDFEYYRFIDNIQKIHYVLSFSSGSIFLEMQKRRKKTEQ